MAERLFFALWPGETERRALSGVQGSLRIQRGRKVHPADIHVTLVFLGQASPEQLACARGAAAEVRADPFELVLDRIGCFPAARVLWCGAAVCPPPLRGLETALKQALKACGFPLERRPYRPHATLARKVAPLRSSALDPPLRWPVASFVLATSRPDGPPRYRIIDRWHLSP